MSKKSAKAEQFKREVETKIQVLVQEFSEGEISTSQFNTLYARYNSQLLLAKQSLEFDDPEAIEKAQKFVATVAARRATEAKPIGLAVYHHPGAKIIQTIGEFDIHEEVLHAILETITEQIAEGITNTYTQNVLRELWLVIVTESYSTTLTIFRKEPSNVQIQEMERLHHDFEIANHHHLTRHDVNADSLAYPFPVFVGA